MKTTGGSDEDAPGRENVHELRLVALLLDLVEMHGRTDTAEILGVSRCCAANLANVSSTKDQHRTRSGP